MTREQQKRQPHSIIYALTLDGDVPIPGRIQSQETKDKRAASIRRTYEARRAIG